MDDSVKNMRQIIKRLLDLILGSRFFKRWMRGFGCDTRGYDYETRDSDSDTSDYDCEMSDSGCATSGSGYATRHSDCDMSASSCEGRESSRGIIIPLPRLVEDPGGERPRVCVILVINLHNYHLMGI